MDEFSFQKTYFQFFQFQYNTKIPYHFIFKKIYLKINDPYYCFIHKSGLILSHENKSIYDMLLLSYCSKSGRDYDVI